MLVDVTRCDRHNEKPLSTGMLRGLYLTKRRLGGMVGLGPMCKGTLPQPPSAGQGGFAS